MARIDGEIITGRPAEVVFDFTAEQRTGMKRYLETAQLRP